MTSSAAGRWGWRLVPVMVAATLAAGLIVVPRPAPVAAETLSETPVIEVTPYCFPYDGLWTITVSGHSFAANTAVIVSDLIYYQKPDDSESVITDEYGTFTASLTVTTNYYYYSNFIEAVYAGDTTGETVAQTYFSYCPSGPIITELVPPCSDEAIPSIHVVGQGWAAQPSDAVIEFKVFAQYGGPQYGETHTINPRSRFDVTWSPGVAMPAGEYDVVISQNSSDGTVENYQQTRFHTPCPGVTVRPDCSQAGAPPNRVTLTVFGSGMDPHNLDNGADIEIIFDPDGKPQTFFLEAPDELPADGSFGPVDIQPYARPDGTYTVEFRQSHNGNGYTVRDVLTTFRVPCYVPTLAVDPICGPPEIIGDAPQRYAITVAGAGFAPNEDVSVTFDPDFAAGSNYPPETFSGVVNGRGRFRLPIDAAYRPPGMYRVVAYQLLKTGYIEASATFSVPCTTPVPTLTIDPVCEPAAAGQLAVYTLNLVGAGFSPGLVELVFDPTGVPFSGSAQADVSGAFSSQFVVDGRPPGAYALIARQMTALGLLDEVTVSLLVPCEGLILRITPSAGPRGFVPLVEGFGFPALTTLELRWDHGIGVDRAMTVQTDENGAFKRQVLIFAHDFTGPREMTVHKPDDPIAYSDLVAPYLVVQGTVTPPFLADNPFGPPDPIVFRR